MALIVIADDEYLLAAMLADILEDEGYETVLASHGQEALERIRSRRPALLITDFMMPVMTGLELAMALKSDPKTSDLPIILVSGAQGSIGRQHGELFAQVLDKPYRNEELLEAVERLLAN
jgi:CheY-like chemotaxis protein